MKAALLTASALAALLLSLAGCSEGKTRITIVDPGHFHASLLLKHKLDGVDRTVSVYAPEGGELEEFKSLVNIFNTRADSPTDWILDIHCSDDFLELLPKAGKKDFAILSGNNHSKARYIAACIDKGYNVLSDKPMAINHDDYCLLKDAFAKAGNKGLVIYDMMTERYAPLNGIIRTLVSSEEVFGTLNGEIEMTDVHHFSKKVAGTYTKRPQWYYDVRQQGEGIADITTHHVDILFWECFPNSAFEPEDVEVTGASHYPTIITPEQFYNTTGAISWPPFLEQDVRDGNLQVFSNGSLSYNIAGYPVRINVRWDFVAEDGAGDTFQSTIPGSASTISIIQNADTDYERTLLLVADEDRAKAAEDLLRASGYPTAVLTGYGNGRWKIDVPGLEKISHEDQFSLVAQAFVKYVGGERMPQWEISNTLTKYFITTEGVRIANGQ